MPSSDLGADEDVDVDVDVAIVGYGPVGVAAANDLGHLGVRTAVFERNHDIYRRARAVTVNDWTMRIFQSYGLDERLKVDMGESSALHWKIYKGHREVFRLRADASGIGHAGSYMIYQPVMEAGLREGVERYADHVSVRFGAVVTGLTQEPTHVTLTVRDAVTGAVDTVRARYVIACDGGSSRMRSELGVELLGQTLETRWIIIDGEMKRWWPDCDQLVFWSDPERPVVDIPLALGHHRWELPLRPHEQESDFDTDDKLWELLVPLGVSPDNVRLDSHAFYAHHIRHAERWRVGRVFLAGDAAHLMPPWAGQGMQSGIRDTNNLAWKLKAVLDGRLGDEVLDTYQPERAPHVALVTEMSQRLGSLIATRNPMGVRARNTLGPILKRVPALTRKLMPATAPAIGEGWLRGPVGRSSAVGRMIPQPPMCTVRGRRTVLDTALGDGFAVLGLDEDPRTGMNAEEVAGWEALEARFLTIRNARGTGRDETDLVDASGAFERWMRQYGTTAIAVRPDRFVAASQPTGLAPPTAAKAAIVRSTA
jgi:3-(3-hydroxy-phenyl)propionate hydroxylase